MTAPERPSLADTIARIDAAIAEPVSNPPCLHCARQALLGSEFCSYHLPLVPQPVEPPPDTSWVTFEKPGKPPVPEPAWGWFGRLLNRLIP